MSHRQSCVTANTAKTPLSGGCTQEGLQLSPRMRWTRLLTSESLDAQDSLPG